MHTDGGLWFSGDWELEPGGAGYYTAYQAVGFDHPWNGWATPVVTASVMARLVWRQNELCTRFAEAVGVDDWTRMSMPDNSVVVFSGMYPDEPPYRVDPDTDGLYHLVDLGWTFEQVDRAEALHTIGDDPDLRRDLIGDRLVKLVEGDQLSFPWAMRIRDRVDLEPDQQLSHSNTHWLRPGPAGRDGPQL